MRFIPKGRTLIKMLTFKISVIESFKSIKVRSYIHSYSFIHSMMSENDKKVPLNIHDFHTK